MADTIQYSPRTAPRPATGRWGAWLRCAVPLLTLAVNPAVWAQETTTPPAAATPAADPAAAAPAPAAATTPHPSIPFAQRDAARAADAAKAASERAVAANQAAAVMQQTLAAAKAAKAAAEQHLAQLPERIKLVEGLQASAAKATEASAAASKSAAAAAIGDAAVTARFQQLAAGTQAYQAQLVKTIAQQRADIKTYEAQRVAADKQMAEATAALKPLMDAKAAAEKVSTEAALAAKTAAERVAFFEATPGLKPDPAKIRLVSTLQHTSPFLSCRIDPTGEFVFGGAQDNSIQRWELATGSKTAFGTHRSWVGALVCPSDSLALISAGYEGQVRWWNPSAMAAESARSIDAHKGFVRVVTVSPDGKLLATGGNDKLVRIWSIADGTPISTISGHENHIYNVAFHPNGKHLVSGDLMGVVKQWSTETWQHERDFDAGELHWFDPTFVAHCGGTRAIRFSPNGKLMAVGGIGNVTNAFAGVGNPMVLVYDWESGKKLQKLETSVAFTGSVWGMEFDPTGEYIVAAGGGGAGAMWVWKPDTPKSVADFKLPATARDLSFHPDGFRVAVALNNNTVCIYDLAPQPAAAAAPAAAAPAK